jgi:P pilus assembly chaperone PapD
MTAHTFALAARLFRGLRRQVAALAILLLALSQQAAMADLMLNPTRIVFDKNQRAAQIDLINNGTETATYRINVVNRRMTEMGDFLPAEKAIEGEHFADSMLVFSPRQVVLAPGAAQLVRVLVRKPADLASGEYRSHLIFDRIPEPSAATSVAKASDLAPNEVGIQLTALVGVSIPIIVRHGETSATVKISNIALLPPPAAGEPPMVGFSLERSGNRSVYGDLVVSFTPAGGSETVIGKASGVAVYAPNALRRAKLALRPPGAIDFARGTLSIKYTERREEGGKQMAQASLVLP